MPGRPGRRVEADAPAGMMARVADVLIAGGRIVVDDAVALLDEVGHPAVALHADTFHMNIEEKELPGAIGRGARHTRHVHFSENDRGTVGSGHVDWEGVARALRAVDYRGWVVAETFAGRVPEIAAATAIWRDDIVPDAWAYARDSVAFMRRLLG